MQEASQPDTMQAGIVLVADEAHISKILILLSHPLKKVNQTFISSDDNNNNNIQDKCIYAKKGKNTEKRKLNGVLLAIKGHLINRRNI